MQSLPRGRSSAGRHIARMRGAGQTGARRDRADRPGRNPRVGRATRGTVVTLFTWIILLGVVPAMAGAAAVSGTHRQRVTLAASRSRVPMFGATILNKATLRRETAQFGRMSIVHVYYSGLPKGNAWTTGLAAANHSAVIVSFNAPPRAILSGADTAVLSHFFKTAPRRHPIYYCYIHEPERWVKLGRLKVAAYKRAWARVVALARAAHNRYLHSTLLLMAYDFPAHRNWRQYLPGGRIISTLGWDAYPVGSALNIHPKLTPPSVFMGPAIAASKKAGLPYGFAEFGLSRRNGRPKWLREVGNYLLHSGALFATLFDGNTQREFLKLTDRPSIEVWRSFVSRRL